MKITNHKKINWRVLFKFVLTCIQSNVFCTNIQSSVSQINGV